MEEIRGERLSKIEEEIETVRQTLEKEQDIYKDETKIRTFIVDQLVPIIMIAKENMLTNCMKNQEMLNFREDIRELSNEISFFRQEMEHIQEFEVKLQKMEDKVHQKVMGLSKELTPISQRLAVMFQKMEKHTDTTSNLAHEMRLRDERMNLLEEHFLEFQKRTSQDVLDKVQMNTKLIKDFQPAIDEVKLASQKCVFICDSNKTQIDEMFLKVSKQDFAIQGLVKDMEQLNQIDLKLLKQNDFNIDKQIGQIFSNMSDHSTKLESMEEDLAQKDTELGKLKNFIEYLSPALTHIQVSDIIQEFLCVPDQMKLIEFDNKRISDLVELGEQAQEQQLSFDTYYAKMEELIKAVRNQESGAPRVNLRMFFDERSEADKLKTVLSQLQSKHALCKKIYNFERQMFIYQGKLDGVLPYSADIVEAVHQRDTQTMSQFQKSSQFIGDVDNDPNHRLKQFDKYVDEGKLMDLQNQHDLYFAKQRQREVQLKSEASKRTLNPKKEEKVYSPNDKTRKMNLFQKNRAASATVEIKKKGMGSKADQQSQKNSILNSSPIPKNLPISSASLKESTKQMNLARHPDYPLLPAQPCSVCGFNNFKIGALRGHTTERRRDDPYALVAPQTHGPSMNLIMNLTSARQGETGLVEQRGEEHTPEGLRPVFDAVQPSAGPQRKRVGNNNHAEGSGMPHVIHSVVHVRHESKINRMNHRYLAKKRAWLIRQIDPAKRYLYMFKKQSKKLQEQENRVLTTDDPIEDVEEEEHGEGEIEEDEFDDGLSHSIDSRHISIQDGGESERQKDGPGVSPLVPAGSVSQESIMKPGYKSESISGSSRQRHHLSVRRTSKESRESVQRDPSPSSGKQSAAISKMSTQRDNKLLSKLTVLQRQITFRKDEMRAAIKVEIQMLRGQIEGAIFAQISGLQTSLINKIQSTNVRIDHAQKNLAEYKKINEATMKEKYADFDGRLQSIEDNQEFLDNMIKKKIENMERIVFEQQKAVDSFMKHIETEYVDFFKNRKRIKQEIASHSDTYKDKFEKLLFLSTEQTIKLQHLHTTLPILAEMINLTREVLVQDIHGREKLSQALKLNKAPNDGYLLMEKFGRDLIKEDDTRSKQGDGLSPPKKLDVPQYDRENLSSALSMRSRSKLAVKSIDRENQAQKSMTKQKFQQYFPNNTITENLARSDEQFKKLSLSLKAMTYRKASLDLDTVIGYMNHLSKGFDAVIDKLRNSEYNFDHSKYNAAYFGQIKSPRQIFNDVHLRKEVEGTKANDRGSAGDKAADKLTNLERFSKFKTMLSKNTHEELNGLKLLDNHLQIYLQAEIEKEEDLVTMREPGSAAKALTKRDGLPQQNSLVSKESDESKLMTKQGSKADPLISGGSVLDKSSMPSQQIVQFLPMKIEAPEVKTAVAEEKSDSVSIGIQGKHFILDKRSTAILKRDQLRNNQIKTELQKTYFSTYEPTATQTTRLGKKSALDDNHPTPSLSVAALTASNFNSTGLKKTMTRSTTNLNNTTTLGKVGQQPPPLIQREKALNVREIISTMAFEDMRAAQSEDRSSNQSVSRLAPIQQDRAFSTLQSSNTFKTMKASGPGTVGTSMSQKALPRPQKQLKRAALPKVIAKKVMNIPLRAQAGRGDLRDPRERRDAK